MVLSNKTQGFQFRLTNFTGQSFESSTRQNVKKRVESILYLEQPPADAVRLSYVASKEITPENNLFIGDRSDDLFANSRTGTVSEFTTSKGKGNVKNKNFLVTQEYSLAESGNIPLFYRHEIQTDYLKVRPESIRLMDKESNPISTDKYKIILEPAYDDNTEQPISGEYVGYHIYNSLENDIDQQTGEYEVFFVQHTENTGVTDIIHTDILNNEKAYREAEFEDMSYIGLNLKSYARAYLLSAELQIQLPKGTDYTVRYIESKRVRVTPPDVLDDLGPWFPRITNGSFVFGASNYSIPEFASQAFNPVEPYKLAAHIKCQKIDDTLIKLPQEEIVFGPLFSYLSLVISGEDGIAKYALTNSPLKAGTDYADIEGKKVLDDNGDVIVWSSDLLLGVDRWSGIVQVGIDVQDSDSIVATFTYREIYFSVNTLNMNPIFDETAHSQLRVVYLVPQSAANKNLNTQVASVKWLKVNLSGLIEGTNQDGSGFNEDLAFDVRLVDEEGYQIEGILGLHYNWKSFANVVTSTTTPYTTEILVDSTAGFPKKGWVRVLDSAGKYRYMYYESVTDTSFVLSETALEAPTVDGITIPSGSVVELVNFVDERTIVTSRDSNLEDDAYGGENNAAPIASQYFVLANLALNPPHGIRDLVQIDVREEGGGIIEEKYEEAKVLNPEIQWTKETQKYNGQVYPGNSVAIVKLPKTLLETFTLEEVQAAAENNVPMGVLPLIQFYGYEPEILNILPFSNNILVEWVKSGPEFFYDVWLSESEEGPYNRHNQVLIKDDLVRPTNLYIIDDLEDEKSYYVKVIMHDRYYQWWYGYSGPDSIEGGLGLQENPPTAPFGNHIGFQFDLTF